MSLREMAPGTDKLPGGDSVLKFGRTPVSGGNGTIQPISYFAPSIYQFVVYFDADLASGGLLLIPGSTTLIAGGKTGTMYLVDSAPNLGHESANDAGAIQEQMCGREHNRQRYMSTKLPGRYGNQLREYCFVHEIFWLDGLFQRRCLSGA